MDDLITGTIKINWSIYESDLNIDKILRKLTNEELRILYDRIEEAVIGAVGSDCVDVYIDGENERPVRVYLDLCAGMNELEIDNGPVNGYLDDLRKEL